MQRSAFRKDFEKILVKIGLDFGILFCKQRSCFGTGDGKIAVVNGTLFYLRKPTLVRKVIRDIIVSCYVFGDRGKMKHVAK